ncbi:hypothetical protein [Nocardia sp. N2S4-5]|uniref:hypothetical protein n=1 Tax=Nocardia sp. N2S4-5 TaxID=3351565 RepID=UPI0037D2E678
MTALRVHLALTACMLVGLAWIGSKPNGGGSSVFLGLVALLVLLAIAWLILVIVGLWRPADSRLWVTAAPLLVAAVIGTQFVISPLEARWHFAQPSFDRALTEVRADPDSGDDYRSAARDERTLGSYQVIKTWKTGANTYFAVEGAGSAGGSGGFVHRPRGAAAEEGCNAQSDEPLTDEWFTFECRS